LKNSEKILIRIIIILKILHFLMNYYLTTYIIIVFVQIFCPKVLKFQNTVITKISHSGFVFLVTSIVSILK